MKEGEEEKEKWGEGGREGRKGRRKRGKKGERGEKRLKQRGSGESTARHIHLVWMHVYIGLLYLLVIGFKVFSIMWERNEEH